MAKISHNADSWHARGVIKRDFQHDHSGPEETPHRKKGGKGKWCGKKEGRVCSFTVKVIKYQSARYRATVMACEKCHRQDYKTYQSQFLRESTIFVNGEPQTRKYWS